MLHTECLGRTGFLEQIYLRCVPGLKHVLIGLPSFFSIFFAGMSLVKVDLLYMEIANTIVKSVGLRTTQQCIYLNKPWYVNSGVIREICSLYYNFHQTRSAVAMVAEKIDNWNLKHAITQKERWLAWWSLVCGHRSIWRIFIIYFSHNDMSTEIIETYNFDPANS